MGLGDKLKNLPLPEAKPGLGERLRVPALKRWRQDSLGDLWPITLAESALCGVKVSKLKLFIEAKLLARSPWQEKEARTAWQNTLAPKRFRGVLSPAIPVKWQGDPGDEDDIPF